ncbi:MAG: nucleotidyl transferase AbiEii/AbiGii toxin family protein [Actinomycetota bacterium]
MTRLRDDPAEFEGAIDAAAQALGLAPLFVEKDYWVTQVLRALSTRYPGWFVFKGGTSLSKGYGLIERFSEDVDILVSPAKEDSARTRETLLLAMTESVAADLDLDWRQGRAPGRGRMAHRADVFVYPRTVRGSTVVPMEDRGVLLETGFAGGDWPGEMVPIAPMLCEPLEIAPETYDDTRTFSLKALKPARTLLEKLSLLHHVGTNHRQGVSDTRCGRHYYDIYRLLDHAATRTVLEDRGQFARILSEVEDISAQHFGGFTERPAGGYADSPAFSPKSSSELRSWLEARYAEASELMPVRTRGNWPTFGQILARVADSRALL